MEGFGISKKNYMPLLARAKNKFFRYFRDTKRRQITKGILSTLPSSPVDFSTPFSVHSLVCRRDITMSICSAKSLNLVCERSLPWIFHDDGSLKEGDFQLLEYHFPGCKILKRNFTDSYVQSLRKTYPLTFDMRDKYVMMLKLIDLSIFSEKEKIVYVDSDILFFREPIQIMKLLSGTEKVNYFNKDIQSCYLYPEDKLALFTGIKVTERINAGLSVLEKSIINLSKIEHLLQQIPLSPNLIYHRIEQTLISLLASESPFGAKHLEKSYDVGLNKNVKEAVCKHYVGVIRHNFELEGLQYLLKDLDFIRRWNEFVAVGNK